MKSIRSIEHRDNGLLLQVLSKVEVKCAIMKENSNRFRPAYASPTLEGYLCYELGPSGEGTFSSKILTSQELLR